jgi:hypothetical protein
MLKPLHLQLTTPTTEQQVRPVYTKRPVNEMIELLDKAWEAKGTATPPSTTASSPTTR